MNGRETHEKLLTPQESEMQIKQWHTIPLPLDLQNV